MFSCEFGEIFKNIFLHGTPLVAASEYHWLDRSTVKSSLRKMIYDFSKGIGNPLLQFWNIIVDIKLIIENITPCQVLLSYEDYNSCFW